MVAASGTIRTCLFDMGNVLVHFCHERMCAQMGALCGRTGEEIRRLVLESGVQWDFERGRHTEDEFHRAFQQAVQQTVPLEELRHAASDIFTLNESIVPVLDALKARGIRLVLLSNTSAFHFEFVQRRWDVLQRFDEFVVSYKVGAIKPEPAIFAAALRAIRCRPDECFYTDDIAAYIAMARRFGLQAEVFTDVTALREQLAERGIPFDGGLREGAAAGP